MFLKKKQLVLGLVVLAVLVAGGIWAYYHVHFDIREFRSQLAGANWKKILFALGCIYVGYIFRSVRWALLLRHNKRVPVLSLIGTQVIGFTAIALIGRVADLVRPYLVSRKTGLDLSSQIAVYIVERLFDTGAIALLFSLAILQLPQAQVTAALSHSGHLAALNHSAPAVASFAARYGGLVLTFLGALFLVGIRLGGELLARIFERILGLVSTKLGHAVGHKIRTFRTGLDTMRSFTDFAATASLSLVMWGLIATAYYETMHAFPTSPQLSALTLNKTVLLMVISGGASIIQLPIFGWFTQIGVVAAAISGFFSVAPEAATACAASLLLVTFLGIIPIGLVWARLEDVNLRRITSESEHAGEELQADDDTARALN